MPRRHARRSASSRFAKSSYARRLRAEQLEDRRMLATITVTSALDNTFLDSQVTLREAIQAANQDISVNGSEAGSGADTIVFDPSLAGRTITLDLGEFELTEAVSIDATGIGVGVTIDAQRNSRLFNITAGTGDFTFAGLTLTGGGTASNDSSPDGGAIRSAAQANLTLYQSTVTDNRVIAEGAGGGIYLNGGGVTLISSTVSGNSTRFDNSNGGGIATISGSVTLNNSTLSGNRTIGENSNGAGISTVSGDVTLTNSTVTNNSTLRRGTIGGGISFEESTESRVLTIQNSIVAGNVIASPSGFDLATSGPGPVLRDIDYSLIGIGFNSLASEGEGNLFGLLGFGNSPLDPLLGPLADNGGPTRTHALLAGSPAIDAADPAFDLAAVPQDQRGAPFSRSFGGRVDIGAYERQTLVGLNLVVDEVSDLVDDDISPGALSLREAIGLANGSIGPDTITFGSPFNSPQTIGLVDQLPTIIEPLTITGPGQALLTLDAGNGADGAFGTRDGFRHFQIDDGRDGLIRATLSGLTLTGGDLGQSDSGGAIRNNENLSVTDVTIIGNSVGGGGGGIYSRSGDLEILRTTISDNRVTGPSNSAGGGVNHAGGALTVTESTISGNRSTGAGAYGGGIYTRESLELNESTISGNRALRGGGIFAEGGVDATQSTITQNVAAGSETAGGGLYQAGGQTSTISGTILSGNTSQVSQQLTVRNDFATGPGQFALTANFSLLGSSVSPTGGSDNLASDSPRLLPLANNGGPTLTHLPQSVSPAVDAGNPAITSGFDQRGAPYQRVIDGASNTRPRIDIGAVEFQPDPQLAGDYNNDNRVDTADYAVWRSFVGRSGPGIPADGNRDGIVDREDYNVWRQHVGATAPPAVSNLVVSSQPTPEPIAAPVEPTADRAETLDTAFALFAPTIVTEASPPSSPVDPLVETSTGDASLLLFALDEAIESVAQGADEEPRVASQEEDENDSSDEDLLIASLS